MIPALDADQQVDMFDGAQNKSNYGERILCLEDLVKESDYEKIPTGSDGAEPQLLCGQQIV